jgi:hypothetical protein
LKLFMNFLNGAIFALLVHLLLNRVPMDHYFGSKAPEPRHSLTQRDYPKGEGVRVGMIRTQTEGGERR